MIPKVIHYCWFGKGEMPLLSKQCIKSWQDNLPDYEIKFWNEDNFNVHVSSFSSQAYNLKKFAFVSDYARVYILKNHGGFYLDIDIEIIKSLDTLLNNNVLLGTDESGFLTAFMASKPNSSYFNDLLEVYDKMTFELENNKINDITNNYWMQEVLKLYGYKISNTNQNLKDNVLVYQDDYFHARSLISGKYNITQNTFAIHHHSLSWISNKSKIIRFFRLKILVPLLGVKLYSLLTNKLK